MRHLRISRRDIMHGYSIARRKHRRDAGAKSSSHYMTQATQSLEVGLTALGMGVLAGKYPNVSLGPVPVDLATALAAHLVGYVGGKYLKGQSHHLHNIGDGAFASYLVKVGAGLGAGMGLKNATAPTASGENALRYHGMPGMNSGAAPLTEAELAAMAQAVR